MSESNLPTETEQKGVAMLDRVFHFVVNGVPHLDEPIHSLVDSYRSKAKSTDVAIAKFIRNQKIKCSTTGFLTGLGGLITLPITLPADLVTSIYIEMRMIAGIAIMRGYNIHDDQVKTAINLCLVGNSVGDVIKKVGIITVKNFTIKKLLPKLTREMIKKINRMVGFKLITKAGSKGVVNISKSLPIIGGLIGGVWNWTEVALYAKFAKKMFNENA